jgi:class 3 adenylate cyclase
MYANGNPLTLTEEGATLAGKKGEVVALFADLRGFSNWCESQPIENVAELMTVQFERVVQICADQHHSFHKFLGDGFVLVWEPGEVLNLEQCLAHAIDAAFELHKKYWYVAKEMGYPIPSGYGVGISIGEAIRIQPSTFFEQMNEVDFVGYPLNCAARLQTLAEGYGTVVCARTAEMLTRGPLLYPDVSGFRRELTAPPHPVVQRAAGMKGLKDADRTGFRYLTYVDSQPKLWRVTGIPAS